MTAEHARQMAIASIMTTDVVDFLIEINKEAHKGEFYVDVTNHPNNAQIQKLKRLGYTVEWGKYGKMRILWTEINIELKVDAV